MLASPFPVGTRQLWRKGRSRVAARSTSSVEHQGAFKRKDHSSSCRCKHCLLSSLTPQPCARPRGHPALPAGCVCPQRRRARPAAAPDSAHGGRVPGPLLPPGGQRRPSRGAGRRAWGRGCLSVPGCDRTPPERAWLSSPRPPNRPAEPVAGRAKPEQFTAQRPRALTQPGERHWSRSGTRTRTMNLPPTLRLDYLSSEGWALWAIFHPAGPFSHACKSARGGFMPTFHLEGSWKGINSSQSFTLPLFTAGHNFHLLFVLSGKTNHALLA